jgi:predicted Zn-dependent protease
MKRIFGMALAAALLAGCTINPVTGERELALVSAADEVAIGQQQYFPSRQMQGGDYVRDPELTRYVAGVGQKLAAVSERALPYEFVVLNSSVPNAWALPGGKIAVNRGLLVELESEAELAAVLGHEIVHAAARHGAQAMQRGLLLQGAVLIAAAATRNDDYSGLAVGAAGIGAQLINQRNGREAELESDLYGMRYMSRAGYDPQAAVTLQETFVRLAEGNPEQGWLAGLFASHPPSDERVARNRETAATLPAAGEVGQERFAAATAGLRRTQGAYETYDRGRKALMEGDAANAESLAQDAVRLVPDEGHFHALLGDIDFERERFADALGHYENAIASNAEFFYYRLRKGMAHQRLSQWDQAQSNLQASLELLPTADAYYGLGVIAERRGDRAAAIENYKQAATSSGPAGQAAQEAVVRLDLPANPGQYVALRVGVDTAGLLIVEIGNPTRVPIADIAVVVRYADAQGALRQVRRVLTGPLAPESAQRWATGLGPFTSADSYEAAIESARVVSQ